jgi:transposase-like protein
MPAYPEEFRRRAVDLVRSGDKTVPQLAASLGISASCLRKWVHATEIDEGQREGLTSMEKKELSALRKKNRQLELENEILRRAAAYFAKENVLPK